jgi:ABC-type bacteriocin/lantibiotic exporter with double-glycine peptidase domain
MRASIVLLRGTKTSIKFDMASTLDHLNNKLLSRLWGQLSKRRKVQLYVLLLLVIIASFFELLSIGAMVPFLMLVSEPEKLFTNKHTAFLAEQLQITDPHVAVLIFTFLFMLLTVVAAGIRTVLMWIQLRVSYGIGLDLGVASFKRTLYQPYQAHLTRNSSSVVLSITQHTRAITGGVIMPVLLSVSASFILLAIVAVLLAVDAQLTCIAGASFLVIYLALSHFSKRKINELGEQINFNDHKIVKVLQESLGGIRDIIVDGTQELFCDIYRRSNLEMVKGEAAITTISGVPKYGIESFTICLLALIALTLTGQPGGLIQAIPALGAIALGAQRMLPLLQQLYSNWISIRGTSIRLSQLLKLVEQPLPSWAGTSLKRPLAFKRSIQINGLSFRYQTDGPTVLNELNLDIKKGSRVGIVGKTGCGKSTLVDIIMGLLIPTEGSIAVDGQSITDKNCRYWQQNIAHVPQSIFLADASILENIAFGMPLAEIDHQAVLDAANQAQLFDSASNSLLQLETIIGERGVRLSGGQRQRIGIARALYKRASLIIFDEATSALDGDTESSVMAAINKLGLDITIIIIAHRISTLSKCDEIIEIGEGKVIRKGTYTQLFQNIT